MKTNFAKTATGPDNRQLTLVGFWQDLAAYYVCDADGTLWTFFASGRHFVRQHTFKNLRGQLLDGRPIDKFGCQSAYEARKGPGSPAPHNC